MQETLAAAQVSHKRLRKALRKAYAQRADAAAAARPARPDPAQEVHPEGDDGTQQSQSPPPSSDSPMDTGSGMAHATEGGAEAPEPVLPKDIELRLGRHMATCERNIRRSAQRVEETIQPLTAATAELVVAVKGLIQQLQQQNPPPAAAAPSETEEQKAARLTAEARRKALDKAAQQAPAAAEDWDAMKPEERQSVFATLASTVFAVRKLTAPTEAELAPYKFMEVGTDGGIARPDPRGDAPWGSGAPVGPLSLIGPSRGPMPNLSKLPVPNRFAGRVANEHGTSPENWFAQTSAYMFTQLQSMESHFQFYLEGPALQWWQNLGQRAQQQGFPLDPARVKEEFLTQYGDPLRYTPDWARRQLHDPECKWHWDNREPLAAYNLRVRDLFTHAGEMAVADQTSWYLHGLSKNPALKRECTTTTEGKPWDSLEALIAHAVQKDLSYRTSRVRQDIAPRLKGPRVAAAAAAPFRKCQGKRGPGSDKDRSAKRPKGNSGAGGSREGRDDKYEQLRAAGLCATCHREWSPDHKKMDPARGKMRCPIGRAPPNCACCICKPPQ